MMIEYNFEDKAVNEMLMDQAYAEAERVNHRDEIKLEDFADLYKDVDRDTAYVQKMEREFENDTPEEKGFKKVATVFESIIYTQGEQNHWFGEDAWTIKSSRYDDIKNKIDTIVEFREEPATASRLGLAVDVTLSREMDKKLDDIKSEIDSGNLAKVKYFKSDYTHARGEISRVPRVIVAANPGTVRALADLWLERNNKVLAAHPMQFQILDEIDAQLKTFRNYAEKNGRHDLLAIYDQAIAVLNGVLIEKHKTLKDTGERDQAFFAIQERLKFFGQEQKKAPGHAERPKGKDTIRVWRP